MISNKQIQVEKDRYIIDVRKVHQEISSGSTSVCKYCGLIDSKYHCGFVADLLKPDIYLKLSNIGFFRSGDYFWKQNSYLSCCKEFAIRMNVTKFQINNKQKKTYKKFTKLVNDNKKPNQNFINKVEELYEEQKENIQLNSNKIQKSIKQNIENKGDSIKLMVENLIRLTVQELFTQQNGFKKQNYSFKIFKTKGKNTESDYYSNIFYAIFIQNKDSLSSINQLIEKFGKLFISLLEKKSKRFIFSIHPQQKLLLFKEINVEKPINQIPKLPLQQINSYDINQKIVNSYNLIKPKQTNLSKKLQNKQPNHEQTLKINYINPDGSIRFDAFSSTYIKIGNLVITLEDNKYDEEIYEIYCSYFQSVHQRDPQSSEKFANEKCNQIIESKIFKSTKDPNQKLFTGTYFFKYRLNGVLIAISHVDILPEMFLSQYFFYKPEMKKQFKLGIISALIEIEYVRQMQKFFPSFIYFNFVQFIPRTTKMNYKADFQKQEILCPETYRWVDLTLDLKKQLYENPLDNPRLAPRDWPIHPDHDFSEMNIEQFLYSEFFMHINQKYLMISDLIPEVQPQIMINLACILQAMGKKNFNSLKFGY